MVKLENWILLASAFTYPSLLPSLSPQTEELVKALQDLENAASGDAAVRQKIASLPQEVQDVSLLEKITGKEAFMVPEAQGNLTPTFLQPQCVL